MKKLSILTLCIIITACQREIPNYAIFSGKIENTDSKTVLVTGENFRKEILIKEDGTFSDTLKIEAKGYYNYKIGNESSLIYLDRGYALHLNIDTNEFDETIKYSGKNANENTFLALKFLVVEKMTGNTKEFYILSPDAFKKKAAEIKSALIDSLAKSNANEVFTEIEKTNIHYDYLANLLQYPRTHSYFAKIEKVDLPVRFLNETEGLDFDNSEDYKNSDGYQQIVTNNFYTTLGAKAKKDSVPFEDIALEYIKTLKSKNIKNGLLKTLSYRVSPNNEKAEDLYKAIIAISTDTAFNNKLTISFNKIKTLAKGQPSPTFNYENYKGGNTTLADLAGKYVYIDVWATWCGPCIAEIPALKIVEKNYHGKNIQFVSISIDQMKDHEKWKKMVIEKELGGIQLFADNDWKSQFVTDYGIEGIPRFILIDPDGKIVTANAHRPSNDRLITLFNELGI